MFRLLAVSTVGRTDRLYRQAGQTGRHDEKNESDCSQEVQKGLKDKITPRTGMTDRK